MRQRTVAALACSVLLAAGCTGPPSEVAEVGDQQIRVDQVRERARAAEQALGTEPGGVSTSVIAQFMVGGLIADQVAAESGLQLTDIERERFLATGGSQVTGLVQLWSDPGTRELAEDWMDPMILSGVLGQEPYLSAAAGVPVVLNPAYGTWDPQRHALNPGGSLSLPASGLTP